MYDIVRFLAKKYTVLEDFKRVRIAELSLFRHSQATFTAYGPSFKQNEVIGVFDNIELYNLMTGKILSEI